MRFLCRLFRRGVAAPADPDPQATLIACLRRDGLHAEAARLHALRFETAWTTGSELLGEFGLAMKAMRRTVRRQGGTQTRAAFAAAKRVVRRAWPQMFWL